MAKTPRTVHVVVKVDTSALEAALQRVQRAEKAREAIRQCSAVDGQHGLPCLRMEDHVVMAGTRHRARRLYDVDGLAQAEWLEWD